MTVVYSKAPPQDPYQQYRQVKQQRLFQNLKKLIPTIMITVGASLLISVGYPIVSYELTTARQTKRQAIIAPVSQDVVSGLSQPAPYSYHREEYPQP